MMNEEQQPKTPYFVFNEHSFTNNLQQLQNSFKKRMDGFKVGYSVKTNPSPYVLKTALENGCYAEVVSPYEYGKAIETGFGHDRIIYNGVCKDIKQAYMCANMGGIVNVDSISELIEIDKYAKHGLRIGVRLTFDVGNGIVSRFGIPIRSRDFQRLLEIDRHSDHIHIIGLSCHITHARSVEAWRLRAKTMADAARKFKNIKYIDLGGNMYSPMEHKFKANFPEHVTFEEYADAVCSELNDTDIDLILETGTPLAANTMSIVCTVKAIKHNAERTFVVVDTSSYDIGIVCRNTKLPYHLVYEDGKEDLQTVEHASIVGYTCIEDDVIHNDFNGKISVGTKIVFRNVGAYSTSFASDFIMPSPDVYIPERIDQNAYCSYNLCFG